MKKLICLGLCFTLLMMTGCGHKAKLSNGKEVVADFSNGSITIEDLYEEMKDEYAVSVLVNMIDKALLNKKYVTDDEINGAIDVQIENLKQQVKQSNQDFNEYIKSYGIDSDQELRDIIGVQIKSEKAELDYVKSIITEKEINDYYKKDVAGDIKASHILIKPDVTDSMTDTQKKDAEAKALQLAKDIIAKLNKGEKFADLAKQYSDDESNKNNGGDLGYFNKGTMDPAFEKAAYELEKNKYSKTPVKSSFGYHIILKTDQKAKPELNTAVKNNIIKTLADKKMQADTYYVLRTKALIELRKANKLKLYDTDLQQRYDSYIKQLLNPQPTSNQ